MFIRTAIIGPMNSLRWTRPWICAIALWFIGLSLPVLAAAAAKAPAADIEAAAAKAPAAASKKVLIAAASNFTSTARALSSAFEQASGHTATLTFGSTGQLYAQIMQGAPFDVFLAADQQRPQRLEAAGRTVAGSRVTYAIGSLVLAATGEPGSLENAVQRLRGSDYSRLAMANPRLAPYGSAAREVLVSLDALAAAEAKVVLGENVGQVFAMLTTGNVQLAFVARAQLGGVAEEFALWPVPASLHSPIRQDLVLLSRAANNPAAIAFLQFLGTAQAQEIIARHGYRVAGD